MIEIKSDVTWEWKKRTGRSEEGQRDNSKLLGVMDMFTILIIAIVSKYIDVYMHVFIYSSLSIYILYVLFIVCQFYLNKLFKGKQYPQHGGKFSKENESYIHEDIFISGQ